MNLIMQMFDMDKLKQQIKDCPKNETVVICRNWSSRQPYDGTEPGRGHNEYDEFCDMLDCHVELTEDDVLIADPHDLTF